VGRAVLPIDRGGGPEEYIRSLARRDLQFAALSPRHRLALWLALDEASEAEALEAEWRRGEELAAIVDGELTEVPGFAEFRLRALRDFYEKALLVKVRRGGPRPTVSAHRPGPLFYPHSSRAHVAPVHSGVR
jgi:hypothetical protein